jgi:Domain of unknown function (DUF1772)
MIITSLALAAAAAFTGAAAYVNWCEQPARLTLDDAQMLKEWKYSYAKGTEMQATLALVSGLLGLAAFYFERRAMAAPGGILMLANWPYTFLAISPTNRRLGAMADAGANPRPLIEKWGRLHAGRTLLGFAGLCAFLFAQVAA